MLRSCCMQCCSRRHCCCECRGLCLLFAALCVTSLLLLFLLHINLNNRFVLCHHCYALACAAVALPLLLLDDFAKNCLHASPAAVATLKRTIIYFFAAAHLLKCEMKFCRQKQQQIQKCCKIRQRRSDSSFMQHACTHIQLCGCLSLFPTKFPISCHQRHYSVAFTAIKMRRHA